MSNKYDETVIRPIPEAVTSEPVDESFPAVPGYELAELIGAGGFGHVYKAVQNNTQQLVAIKILKLNDDVEERQKQRLIERFERETQLCSELHHPNIVQLLDKGQTDEGKIFTVFEFVEGQTLKDMLIARGGLSATETGEIMLQVLEALACAHAKGIVHRDLKPHNMMVKQTETRLIVKILDFGIGAFILNARRNDYKSLTLTQESVGTPTYSAPEQLRGEPPTVKTDIYAWGLVFLECLTGRPVMQGSSLAEVFHKQLNPSPVPLPPEIIDHPMAAVLRRCLEKNPNKRVEHAATLYDDVKKLNFSAIVGGLSMPASTSDAYATPSSHGAHSEGFGDTIDVPIVGSGAASLYRQLSVLCFRLSIVSIAEDDAEFESLETLLSDQLSVCMDIALRYGATVAGQLGDCVMLYFGYPNLSDNDARRAARTALELSEQVARRSALLEVSRGVKLSLSMGMHCGKVITRPDVTPTGLTPNTAMTLLQRADENTALVSASMRKLLDQYIEFERADKTFFDMQNALSETYLLTGERHTEALFFLQTGSADRPFVGRQNEFVQLQSAWDRVKNREDTNVKGQAVLLIGEPGIGKSRLTHELRRHIRGENYISRECRCLPEHQNNALYPILDMLRLHLRLRDAQSDEEALERLIASLQYCSLPLEESVPVMCAWLSLPIPEAYPMLNISPDRQKNVLLEVLEEIIVGLSDQQPFLLIIEDLHWLDPTSQELVDRLVLQSHKNTILVVMTTRPEYTSPEIWASSTDIVFHSIELHNLSQESASQMAQAVAGSTPIEEKTLQKITQRCDGIPLFVEELTRMLIEGGLLIKRDEYYCLAENVNWDEIPITLEGSLHERLDRLGQAKETAQLAAAIGREFDYRLLVSASLRDEAQVQADVDALVASNLVYRQRRLQAPIYLFRHALIRDAAYDSMLSVLRERVHASLAHSIELQFPEVVKEQPFEVARHFAGAREYLSAVKYAKIAIKQLILNSFNEEALEVSEKALRWVELIPSEVHRYINEIDVNSIINPTIVMVSGWGSEKIRANALRSQELIKHITSSGECSAEEIQRMEDQTEWSLLLYNHYQANRAAARELGERLLEQSIASNDRRRELAVRTILGQACLFDGDIADAQKILRVVIEKYDEEKDLTMCTEYGFDPYQFSIGNLSCIESLLGGLDDAMEYCNLSIENSIKTENVPTIATAYTFAMCVTFLLNDKDLAKKYASELLDNYGDQIENNWVMGHFYQIVDWAEGSTERSEKITADLIASGQDAVLSWYEPALAATHIENGNYQRAIEVMKASIQRNKERAEGSTYALAYRYLAMAYYHQDGNLEAHADEYFNEALNIAREQNADWLYLLATYEYAQAMKNEGRKEEAFSRLQTAIENVGPFEKPYSMLNTIKENMSSFM